MKNYFVYLYKDEQKKLVLERFSPMNLVFCYQNCSDLLWEKNVLVTEEKLLKFEAEGWEFAKFLRSLWTIYLNSERSEQILVTEYFFNLFLEVSHI